MRGERDGVPRTAGELRRLRLLDLLEDAQLEQILTVARFEVLRARSNRTYAELIGDEACFVWKGQIRVAAQTPSGSLLTLGTVPKGGMFGLGMRILGAKPRDGMRVVADQPTALMMAPADLLYAYAHHEARFLQALLTHFAMQAAWTVSRLYELAAFDVRTRLLCELLRLAQAQGGAHAAVIHPAPTHAVLAAQIGATREAVSRHLSDLATEGVISVARGEIRLLRPGQIRRMARAPAGEQLIQINARPDQA